MSSAGLANVERRDPAGIRTTVINPDGSKLIQPFPHYEEQRAANGTLLKKRTSYSLGGQLIALDEDGVIRYAHNDHLGSPAILMQKDGDIVLNSTIARYKPYGGYLTEPSATALDRGYTGHDRTAADDGLGLVYMNARYLDSRTGRFISADTLVPEPGNPQAFNRYSYALGNPVGLVDPSGHCAGTYNQNTGIATEDQECWDYLFGTSRHSFCSLGSRRDICGSNIWTRWLTDFEFFIKDGVGYWSFAGNAWTKAELELLRDGILGLQNAFSTIGIDFFSISQDIRYSKSRPAVCSRSCTTLCVNIVLDTPTLNLL